MGGNHPLINTASVSNLVVELPWLTCVQYLEVFHILNLVKGRTGKFGRLTDLGGDSDLFEGLHRSCDLKLTLWIYLPVT